MDRKMELDHLAIAEKAVADGERHIEREEQAIADMDRAGHDTKLACATLANFRHMQAEHVAHRDLLLKMLQDAAKPRLTTDPIFRPGHYDPSAEPVANKEPIKR